MIWRTDSFSGSTITCNSSSSPPRTLDCETPRTRSNRDSISFSAKRRSLVTSRSLGSSSSISGNSRDSSRSRSRPNPTLCVSRMRWMWSASRGCWSWNSASCLSSGRRALRMNQAIGRSEELAVEMTGWSASSGYSRTCCSRLLTFSKASSMSVPTRNSSVIRDCESELSELIFESPSTLLSCSSCSSVISRSISWGLAPGQRVSIVIVGVWTSGVSCIGIRSRATMPNIATSRTPTVTLTGLRTKDSIRCMA